MSIRNVTILGGSGFVGLHLARVFAERGIACCVPTRNRDRAKRELLVLPNVTVVEANVYDDADLDRMLAGADAVVNLIGILHETGRQSFQRAHADLPRRVVQSCERTGVARCLHMSALCADVAGPSRYLRSKGEGEARAAAGTAQGIDVTIFRPSIVFGRGDSFINLFATMLRFAPVIPLGSPDARFQPVWVEDVVRAMADSLSDRATFGQRYDLCGPEVYTLRELVRMTGRAVGCPRPVVGLGNSLSYLQAAVMELSPVKLITRDNVRSMSVDNVCGCGWPEVFRFRPSALGAILPTYLGSQRCRAYDGFRTRARR